MATFVMLGRYSQEGLKNISAARTRRAEKLVKKCRGKICCVYGLLGAYDVIVVADFPGVKEAMKASIGLAKLTGIGFVTSPAVSVEELDQLAG
jgi:uncharacterized protein with GYD domain